MLSFM